MAVKNKYIAVVIAGAMLLFFQNCGQPVAFSEDPFNKLSSDNLALIGEDSLDGGVEVINIDDGLANQQDGDGTNGSSGEEEVDPISTVGDSKDSLTSDDIVMGKRPEREKEERVAVQDQGQFYRCVLNAKGQAYHIGLLDGKAAVDINTPDTLCMSRHACEVIMAEKFDVKFAKFTGYCKNDKAHTVRITDGEALKLVEDLDK